MVREALEGDSWSRGITVASSSFKAGIGRCVVNAEAEKSKRGVTYDVSTGLGPSVCIWLMPNLCNTEVKRRNFSFAIWVLYGLD